MVRIEERGIRRLQSSPAFDIHLARPIHENVADERVAEELVERPVAEDLVHDLADDLLSFRPGQGHFFLQQQGVHALGALGVQLVERDSAGLVEVHDLEQLAVDPRLDLDSRIPIQRMPAAYSDRLDFLVKHVYRPPTGCRSRWTAGSRPPVGGSPSAARTCRPHPTAVDLG